MVQAAVRREWGIEEKHDEDDDNEVGEGGQ
jgi:hypothetical protein